VEVGVVPARRRGRRRWPLLAALPLLLALGAWLTPAPALAAECRAVAYLTLDTGNMRHAEEIAAILNRHGARATFFLSNEKTPRGDFALDASWADYWKARAAEGHAFGSHTWRHGRIGAATDGIRYRPQFGEQAGQTLLLDDAGFCRELQRVDTAFRQATGRGLDAVWRAPGGVVTPRAQAAAQACGYAHVQWAPAGFLGDELPSDRYPNRQLLERALRDIRDGDVLMAHLGIWSRQEPFAPMLDPLLAGLRQRGFCLRTLVEHPDYRPQAPRPQLASAAPRAATGGSR
jgi:peptidoglycan/xylan/chitin deacetylase (PgdA/CDA1 family)